MRVVQGIAIAVLLMAPSAGFAQTVERVSDERRLFVDVNLIGPSATLSERREFTSRFITSGEIATSLATYAKPSGQTRPVLIDFGGGVLLTRVFGIGAAYSRTAYDDRVSLQATVPHPLFLDAPATTLGVTDRSLVRTEAATHLFIALLPVRTDRSQLRLSGGPSFFSYSADMVKEVLYNQTFSEEAPQSTVNIAGFTSEQTTGRAIGFHVGLDYAHFLTETFGLTGGMRYSYGTVGVSREPLSTLPQEFRVGGRLFFLGVRFRFRN
jgi:hypothetical protein